MKVTFENWIDELKREYPNLKWDLMTDNTMTILGEIYNEMVELKDKSAHNRWKEYNCQNSNQCS